MAGRAPAFGSTIVAAALLAGLATGGWTVLSAPRYPNAGKAWAARAGQPGIDPTPAQIAAGHWSAQDWAASADAYGELAGAHADNATFAFRYAYSLHMLGRYEQAVAAHDRAAGFPAFRTMARYNQACALAKLGRIDESFAALDRAVEDGFAQSELIRTDADLESLHEDPRWANLLAAFEAPASSHAMAFWVGVWQVRSPDGQLLGTNRITREQNGHVVRESWTGADGSTGTSLNFLDPATGHWRQIWVDAQGGVLDISGSVRGDGSLLMTGTMNPVTGTGHPSRMILMPIEGGGVRQVFETSDDEGRTWRQTFEGIYSVPTTAPQI